MKGSLIWSAIAAVAVAALILNGPTLSQPSTASQAALAACLRQTGSQAAVARIARTLYLTTPPMIDLAFVTLTYRPRSAGHSRTGQLHPLPSEVMKAWRQVMKGWKHSSQGTVGFSKILCHI